MNHVLERDSETMANNEYRVRVETNGSDDLELKFSKESRIEISYALQPGEDGTQPKIVGERLSGILDTADLLSRIEVSVPNVNVKGRFTNDPTREEMRDFRFKTPISLDETTRIHTIEVGKAFTLYSRNKDITRAGIDFGPTNSFDFIVKIPAVTTVNGSTSMIVRLKNVGHSVGGNETTYCSLAYSIKLQKQPLVYVDENVGIGTTNPQAKLDVNGNAVVQGRLGVGTTEPNARLDVAGSAFVQDLLHAKSNVFIDRQLVLGTQNFQEDLLKDREDLIVTSDSPGLDLIDTDPDEKSWRIESRFGELWFSGVGENVPTLAFYPGGALFYEDIISSKNLDVQGKLVIGEESFNIDGKSLAKVIDARVRKEMARILRECTRTNEVTTTTSIAGLTETNTTTSITSCQ
jgi:hypothetical protein